MSVSVPETHRELESSAQSCLAQGKLREITEWASPCECCVVLKRKREGQCIGEEFGFPVTIPSVKHARHRGLGKNLREGDGI